MTGRTRPPALCLQVRLQPRAVRDRIMGWQGDALKVQVHAPPVDGAANASLVELLAATLAVPRRAVRIVHGSTSRDKIVQVDGLEAATCRRRLDAALTVVDKGRSRR